MVPEHRLTRCESQHRRRPFRDRKIRFEEVLMLGKIQHMCAQLVLAGILQRQAGKIVRHHLAKAGRDGCQELLQIEVGHYGIIDLQQ